MTPWTQTLVADVEKASGIAPVHRVPFARSMVTAGGVVSTVTEIERTTVHPMAWDAIASIGWMPPSGRCSDKSR